MPHCLIVDDSRLVRRVIREIVQPMGYTTDEAENGQEAFDLCQKTMPDLIMLDWNMPVMNGLEFLEKLRASPNGGTPKVIFCTTENEMGRIVSGMQAGANEYVMKPFDAGILKEKISQIGLPVGN